MPKKNKKSKGKIKGIQTEKIEIDILKSQTSPEGKIEIKETFESDEIIGGRKDDTTVITHWPTTNRGE